MSVNLDGFDAEKVEPNVGFDPVPAGEYIAVAVQSEFKPTKAGDGEYLMFTHEIIEGQYRGRRVFDRLNLKNKNDTAVKIAQGTLSALCRAVGVMRPRDSAELHNKPFKMRVIVEENKEKKGEFGNSIKAYSAANGAAAPPSGASAGASASAAATPKPWERKAS